MKAIRHFALPFLAWLVGLGWSGYASAGLMLPACSPPTNCLLFGDFAIYSLPLLNGIATGGDFVPQSGTDPFRVQSGPGQIDGGVVFGTGASGNPVNWNFAGMDNAYPTPNAAASFSTSAVADPGTLASAAPFATPGDQAGTWDARVPALRSFLAGGGGAFVPFFNLNETGTDGLDGIDLLIWLHVWLEDTDGVAPQKDYFVTADKPASLGGGPDETAATPETDSRWVYVYGTFCVNGTSFLHLGPCTGADPAGSQNVDQNLGADNAGFAIFNQELSDLILDAGSGYDFLHVDWRMARLNGGFEQAFLLADTTVTRVPEPGMPWIWGAFLVALGAFGRRRSR